MEKYRTSENPNQFTERVGYTGYEAFRQGLIFGLCGPYANECHLREVVVDETIEIDNKTGERKIVERLLISWR